MPLDRKNIQRELSTFASWYNGHRPQSALRAATQDEGYFRTKPRSLLQRFEPRRKWPRRSPCAEPQIPTRGRRGVRLDLVVRFHEERGHLPIVELKRTA